MIEGLGPDVFDLQVGQRVFLSPHLRAAENVAEPAEALLALTAEGTALWLTGLPVKLYLTQVMNR